MSMDPRQIGAIHEVGREPLSIETKVARMPDEIVVLELVLILEKEVVHVPEPTLGTGDLRGQSRTFRERVNVILGKVAEDETDLVGDLFEELTDRVIRPTAVHAFELSILNERYRSVHVPADVVGRRYGSVGTHEFTCRCHGPPYGQGCADLDNPSRAAPIPRTPNR